MQKYGKNMQKYALKYAKYAELQQKSIFCIFCIYMHFPLCWCVLMFFVDFYLESYFKAFQLALFWAILEQFPVPIQQEVNVLW